MRGTMILFGIALVRRFHFVLYIFGLFLLNHRSAHAFRKHLGAGFHRENANVMRFGPPHQSDAEQKSCAAHDESANNSPDQYAVLCAGWTRKCVKMSTNTKMLSMLREYSIR